MVKNRKGSTTLKLVLTAVSISAFSQQQLIPAKNDSRISRETRDFLNVLNNSTGKPLEKMSPKDARLVLSGAQASVHYDYSDIEESEKTIIYNGQELKLHIIKPKGSKSILPVFMFFHGGGWVLGDFPTHKRLVRDLVVNSGAAAVFPDYTPSPEAKFPTPTNQAYEATKWVAQHGSEIGVDSSRLAVVGNSVGGNMAAVVAMMAKDNNGPTICQQILLWPVTDADFSRLSYKTYAQERFLTTPMMKWMWDNYLPSIVERKNKYASPLQANLEELKGLPPTLIQLAENDILHDEGLAYGRKLDEAGVPTTITEYRGFIHDYGMLNPLAKISSVKVSVIEASEVLKRSLFK